MYSTTVTLDEMMPRSIVAAAALLLSCLLVPLSSKSIDSSCIYTASSVQPALFVSKLTTSTISNHSYNSSSISLLNILLDNSGCISASTVSIQEQFAVPSTQAWSRCMHCGLKDNDFLLYRKTKHSRSKLQLTKKTKRKVEDLSEGEERLDLSWSLWSEFFHHFDNDKYNAKIVSLDPTSHDYHRINYYIPRPVYIIPTITLHIGHILIDILEQIYHSHMKHYGRIRTDSLLILDVANKAERDVLQEKIDANLGLMRDDVTDSLAVLMRAFTDLSIYSYELLDELRILEGGVLFADLHIGLDNSGSFFHRGQNTQPCLVSVHANNKDNMQLSKRYQSFRTFINDVDISNYMTEERKQSCLSMSIDMDNTHPQVLIGQRSKSRTILNIDDIAAAVAEAGLTHSIYDLGVLSFSQQKQLFSEIDIFVSMSGTSVHNLLFMRPGTAVIIFMQPMWCAFAWMYANQAILLGIKPIVYCSSSAPLLDGGHMRYHQLSRSFWLQGPRHSKSDNVTINIPVFVLALRDAMIYIADHRANDDHDGHSQPRQALSQEFLFHTPICPDDGKLYPMNRPGLDASIYYETHALDPPPPPSAVDHDENRRPSRRVVELYISSITLERFSDASVKVGITGEIGVSVDGMEALLQSMPGLSICMQVVPPIEDETVGTYHTPPQVGQEWCHQVRALNYYSDIFLTFYDAVQRLHIWAQVSSSGGKLRGSDLYYVLDTRLYDAGASQHTEFVGQTILFEVELFQQCLPRRVTMESANKTQADSLPPTPIQVIRYPMKKFNITSSTEIICDSRQILLFNHTMRHRLSLQRHSTDFCLTHRLTPVNCADFIGKLNRFLLLERLLQQNSIPTSQIYPTVSNPFFFLHIEKTAGTTIRQYIFATAESRKINAFIPCKTDPCMIFSLPKHNASSTFTHVAGRLSDLDANGNAMSRYNVPIEPESDDPRSLLMRGPARDMSNVSIIAGHFDFDALYALPQCSAATAAVAGKGRSSSCSPHCFVVARHPIDRAISYYYQRAITTDIARNRSMNELTAEELELIVLSVRVAETSTIFSEQKFFIDDGMSDAACRAILPGRYTVGLPVGDLLIPPEIPESLYPTAVSNVQQCVIGMQEDWDNTMRVLDHWFPWIDYTEHLELKAMKLFVGQETRLTLRADLYNVLFQLNKCDFMLFENMKVLFLKQLEILKYALF